MEVQNRLTRCKKCGGYYDANAHDECPYCNLGVPLKPIRREYPPYLEKCSLCKEYYDTREYASCPHCSPVGWLEAVEGPHKGEKFKLHAVYNYIGSEHGDIRLPNDPEICRERHAMVAYIPEDGSFYFGPTVWKIVKLNGHNVYNHEQIHTGDVIEVGGTKLVLELTVDEDVKN